MYSHCTTVFIWVCTKNVYYCYRHIFGKIRTNSIQFKKSNMKLTNKNMRSALFQRNMNENHQCPPNWNKKCCQTPVQSIENTNFDWERENSFNYSPYYITCAVDVVRDYKTDRFTYMIEKKRYEHNLSRICSFARRICVLFHMLFDLHNTSI